MHAAILIILLAGSVVMRIKMAPEIGLSSDYELYIKGWPMEYRTLGFAQGMSQVIGDYYVPFNIMYALIGLSPWEPWVLASLFSSVMDYALAAAVYLLVTILLKEERDHPERARSGSERSDRALLLDGTDWDEWKAAYLAVLTLYLPVVFMNSALWKQCDVFYIFFAVLALTQLYRAKDTSAFILLGISFSFKLQAIFFFPFFLLFLFLRREKGLLKYLNFLWIPTMYLITGLPAVILGRGIRATYGTYFMQMLEGTEGSESYGMVANYPNFYNYGLDDFLGTLALPAAIVTMAVILLSIALAAQVDDGYRLDLVTLTWLLAWQIWAMNMFLPSMHERYDYGAVLLFSLLLALRPRESFVPASVLTVGTLITYVRSARELTVSMDILTAVYIAAFFWTTRILVRMIRSAGSSEEKER
ncbi:MAG: hypothetical protein IK096_01890 [Lachnospiraceae bacterium]|nr:hypothetical protein [Lachnospiraceae bacterium]